MPSFLSTIPGFIATIIASGASIVVVIVGALYVVGLWKGKKDNEDDRLINILKGTVDALEKKVDDQKKNHDEILSNLTRNIQNLTAKVDNLERENETLTRVLQGRDEQTQLFYKKAFEAIETGNKTFALVDTMNKNHTDLMKMLVEHLKPGVTINQPNNSQDHISL